MFKPKLKKGDEVLVIAGAHRGKKGRVLKINASDTAPKILVEGINMVKRHTKKSQAQPDGGIIEREAPLAYSNVAPVSSGKEAKK